MSAMNLGALREELVERRRRLAAVAAAPIAAQEVTRLLRDVDAALHRIEQGRFGVCGHCHGSVEADRLAMDPLLEYCLDCLTESERRGLEQDLELAARIQYGLLPRPKVQTGGWEVQYRYRAAGPVSGDYCDVAPPSPGRDALYLVVADVSGKGVAASLLMSHLAAAFRTLIDRALPLTELVACLNRVFCESAPPNAYATMFCAKASPDGTVEWCNAGHPAPLWLRDGVVQRLDATGVPIGMFCSSAFASEQVRLAPGQSLVVHTDGVTEARNSAGREYGAERFAELVGRQRGLPPGELADACLADLAQFLGGARPADDLTLMVVRREAVQ